VLITVKKKHQNIGKGHSQFFVHLVKSLLSRYQEYKMNRQYIRGYKQIPETEEEAEIFLCIASIAIADDPW
jgi:hypothetical protein